VSTEQLRRELARVADRAPVADVPDDTFARAQRARRRDRLAVGAAVVVVLALAGGLAAWLPGHDEPEPADGRGAVPDRIHLVPERLTERRGGNEWSSGVVSSRLDVGSAAAAYVADAGLPVIVGADDGDYHLLDLPDFAGNNWVVARGLHGGELALSLSPDGRRLAYAYAVFGPDSDTRPIPSGLRVVDLESGSLREIPVRGGEGTIVSTIRWSPGGRWLVWSGYRMASWTEMSMGGSTRVAGVVAPDGTASSTLPGLGGNARVSYAVSDAGQVSVVGDRERYVDGGELSGGRRPLRAGGSFTIDAAYVGDALYDLRVKDTAYRFQLDAYHPAHTRLSLPADLDGRAVVPLGWVDASHFLARVGPEENGSTPEALTGLALVGVGDDPSYRVVGEIDEGVPTLSVATDLIALDQPTVARPDPDWPWSTTRWLVTIGLGSVALIVVLWLVLLHRRRP
jgi:hypothetical protein